MLYKSKYGASARYASMLAEALGTEAQELDRAGAAALSGCERAVFVGGVYAGGVAGLQNLQSCSRAAPWGEPPYCAWVLRRMTRARLHS